MPKEVTSAAKVSVLDCMSLVITRIVGLAPSPAHNISSRSIFRLQTRTQGSPDLEAMPHQVTSLLTVFDTFPEKLTFFQKYTTPLKYSIKNQKLKNHHATILHFFLANSIFNCNPVENDPFPTSLPFLPHILTFGRGHLEVRLFSTNILELVWRLSPR